MELREFLNRFLPDFKQKEIDFADNKIAFHIRIKAETQAFYEKYFPEALQNFADKICEQQRENCAIIYAEEVLSGDGLPILAYNIINAEQPEIEELLTT